MALYLENSELTLSANSSAYKGVLTVQSTIGKILGVLFIFLMFGCTPGPSEKHIAERSDDNNKLKANVMIGYDEFLIRIKGIHIGNNKGYVEKIVGEPDSRSDTIWSYDLKKREGFPGLPPVSGTTVFTGIEFLFEDGQVKEIKKNWIDVTGPAH